jgi:hypothetical protein
LRFAIARTRATAQDGATYLVDLAALAYELGCDLSTLSYG